jgi:NodT family efflux transporter outer membrane factor (OMF) lipoprotein
VRRVVCVRRHGYYTALLATLLLTGCAVGPDYFREPAPVPAKFKELKGWKPATPRDSLDRGNWWAFYHDPKLAQLIKQVEISNQTVAVSAATYEQARALIREAQASLFPTVNGNYTFTRTRTGPNAGSGAGAAAAAAAGAGVATGATYTSTFVPQLNASWEPDVWGKVRRQIESNTAAAQADAADLDNAKLSEQALLATAYFNLRAEDSLADLLRHTVAEYQKNLTIVQNQFKAGYSVTAGDVATAQAQVETTQAQLVNTAVARAQDEHAIAMLIGRPPAELTIAPILLSGRIPKIPVTVPSTLLERRPDIAAAERTMQAQNALIGVAVAGYFPTITLSGLLEWIGKNPLPFNVANEIWSVGAAGSEVVFNGGLTSAQVDAARAAYWESVATYRQTVLTAFQQVEDELAAIHYLSQQLVYQQQAVKDARRAVDVYLNQFQAGTVAFTTVVVAEVTLLGDEEAELTIRQDLFLASVSLIEALGGGWDSTLLPRFEELQNDFSLLPQLPANPVPETPQNP